MTVHLNNVQCERELLGTTRGSRLRRQDSLSKHIDRLLVVARRVVGEHAPTARSACAKTQRGTRESRFAEAKGDVLDEAQDHAAALTAHRRAVVGRLGDEGAVPSASSAPDHGRADVRDVIDDAGGIELAGQCEEKEEGAPCRCRCQRARSSSRTKADRARRRRTDRRRAARADRDSPPAPPH